MENDNPYPCARLSCRLRSSVQDRLCDYCRSTGRLEDEDLAWENISFKMGYPAGVKNVSLKGFLAGYSTEELLLLSQDELAALHDARSPGSPRPLTRSEREAVWARTEAVVAESAAAAKVRRLERARKDAERAVARVAELEAIS